MISEKVSAEVLGLLSCRLSSMLRKVVSKSMGGGSITSKSMSNSIVFPLLAVDSVPRDVVLEVCKFVEVKLAYDIKNILEKQMVNLDSASYDDVVLNLPFQSLFNRGEKIIDLRRDSANILGGATSINVGKSGVSMKMETEIAHMVESYAIGFCNDIMKENGICKLIKGKVDRRGMTFAEAPSSEIIKERGATPTAIDVELKYVTAKGEIKTFKYTFPIECIPKYVDSNELKLRISRYNPRRMFKQFVQMSNKEISFVRDFLLDLDSIKLNAKDSVMKDINSNIFAVVERQHKIKDMGINVYPFLCMLISKDFKDELLETEKVDLDREWKTVMKKFFAMGLFIHDSNTDLVEYAYDGSTILAKTHFDELSREGANAERALKKLQKIYE
ncbi:MAG: hypothetical protein ACRC92_11355 [Peptostreptococcaceae bacterium]